MDGLLELPFWRLKPYVRPKPTREIKKRKTESLEQNKRRKIQKAERVKKFHEKALNEVFTIIYHNLKLVAKIYEVNDLLFV